MANDRTPKPHPRPGPKPPVKPSTQIPNWLFYIVVLFVLFLWAGCLVLTIVVHGFEMPPSVNGAVPIVLVALFGTKAASDRRGGPDDK